MKTKTPFKKQPLTYRRNLSYESDKRGIFKHDDSIYKYNNLGYRSNDDFFEDDPSKKIMFLGCSLTEAVGVSYEKSWPYLVTKAISEKTGEQYKNYNLSENGASSDYICRLLYQTIDVYNPDILIILFPTIDRREYFTEEETSFSVNKTSHITPSKLLLFNELRNEFTDFYNTMRNILFIEEVIKLKNIKRVYSCWDRLFDSSHSIMKHYIDNKYWLTYDINKTWYTGPLAIDGIHPGEQSNQLFSNEILKKLQSTYII